nr:9136_t:CDS:2 [Entrophospora candida]CAG8559404.1 2148_t:CDS:2 [Entrophospora candida]
MSNLSTPGSHEGRQPTMLESWTGVKLESLPNDVRRNFTKIDPRLPIDIKNIALWIKEEKNLIISLQNASNERKGASKCLAIWGKDSGNDIADVTEKLSELLNRVADVEIQHRKILKEIREAEERLIVPRERTRKINEERAKILKSHPKSPRIKELEEDLRRVKLDCTADEADVGNLKRRKLKDSMISYLGATFEAAEKIALISGFGWDLLSHIDSHKELPGEGRPQYNGYQATAQILKDCQIALHRWQEPQYDIKPLIPGLTNTASAVLAAQKQEYEAKLNQLTNSMKTLKDEHDIAVTEFASNLETNRQEYEKQIHDYANALTEQKRAYEEQLNEISNALNSNRQSSEAKVNELTSKLNALSAQNQELDAKHASDLKSHEEQINQLSISLGAQRKQYDSQLKQYNNIITEKHEYEVALSERDALIAKLQGDVNSVVTEKEKLTNLVKDLEDALKSKSSTTEEKDKKINKLEDDISGIKNQLSNLNITSSQIPELSSPILNRSLTNKTLSASSNDLSPSSATSNSPPSSNPQSENQNSLQTIGPQFQQGFGNVSSPPLHQNTMYGGQQFYQQPFYQPQQSYYGQGPHPAQSIPYGFQQQQQMSYGPIPPPPQQQPPQGEGQQQGQFTGGFYVASQLPDDAPPAYDGPPEGFSDDKKK